MYKPVYPGLRALLFKRGVGTSASIRVEYLNRNVTEANFAKTADPKATYGQQAANVIEAAFDFRDSREGVAYWQSLCESLKQTS